ncbi:SH3 domain-containing protein [Streptomyces sp. NPDC059928]|uniref:SH3 domain-containing protein n=1 Tax=unclassified Streptomyces TaxID=2593676 RepID=UPI00365D9F3D
MLSTRMSISVVMLGVVALSLPTAHAASAATAPAPTATVWPCTQQPSTWVIGTKAVTIRSQATAKSTARGVLYQGHVFTVHKTSGNWHYITDKATGVKGWVSGTYVYRDVAMCLD